MFKLTINLPIGRPDHSHRIATEDGDSMDEATDTDTEEDAEEIGEDGEWWRKKGMMKMMIDNTNDLKNFSIFFVVYIKFK